MTEKLIKVKVADHMSKIRFGDKTYTKGEICYLPENVVKGSSSVVIIDEPEPVKVPATEPVKEPVKEQVPEQEPEAEKEPEVVKLNKGGRPKKV